MLESVFKQVHNVKHLILALWGILGCQVKDDALTPLIELLNPIQKMNNQRSLYFNAALVRSNFIDSFDCINDYESIVISSELVQSIQELSL